jgi:hypothetical protein
VVGKGGLEPPWVAPHDPKSCSSASSDTSPEQNIVIMSTLLTKNEKGHKNLLTRTRKHQQDLLTKFLSSRRQGLSPHTIAFYEQCLKPLMEYYALTSEGINRFLSNPECNDGGKLAYFGAIRVLCHWLLK